MQEFEIQNKGLIGNIIFLIVRVSHFVQETVISNLIWKIISLLLKFLKSDPAVHVNDAQYIVDPKKKIQATLWNLINGLFKLSAKISGVRRLSECYPEMLSWNENIPIFAYVPGKGNGGVRVIGGELIFLSSFDYKGELRIIKKYIDQNNLSAVVMLVWSTGDLVGKIVLSNENAIKSFKDLENAYKNYDTSLQSIYVPPRWLAIVIELILSLGTFILIASAAATIFGIFDKSTEQRLREEISGVNSKLEGAEKKLETTSNELMSFKLETEKILKVNASKIPLKKDSGNNERK